MHQFFNPALLNKSDRWIITVLLIATMFITRDHHFASSFHLPDASLAVFFLAGRYIRSWTSWLGLFAVAFAYDYSLITFRGVDSYCFTVSYGFLVLAYGAMWFGGLYTHRARINKISDVFLLLTITTVATVIAFAISNGSFYWLSGRYPEPNMTQYVERVLLYLPEYVKSPWLWLIVAAVAEYTVLQWRNLQRNSLTNS